jgi:hypothetical protein
MIAGFARSVQESGRVLADPAETVVQRSGVGRRDGGSM